MSLGALALPGVLGPLFVGHGTQKLLGWFDGPGVEGTSGMMENLAMRPARRHAFAAGVAETTRRCAAHAGRADADGDDADLERDGDRDP
jgi:putative oxidoreductase